ncbi:MAG: site-specific DNA-methyltransferase [Deltaproteobacteria bacterium]|nr:site-specific DNA-methyltransferase [Deltaproteobacteria bacterium]MBW2572014.1 site-specific DNA-methyltransferase [Deltaproteobacteria bacterium]MBW2669669.1 site-specific DNA-methyltransferase [Deltaproteobacteria bacterium]MBW2710989.1 site-specific DNA-methyltransferase [Deltaproteobacteria bacterium]
MTTNHSIIYSDSKRMDTVPSESVNLIVTSPPYPMIQMWDELFGRQNPHVGKALEKENGTDAFELMHTILDPIWAEVYRVLKFGGFACINIGDATRTIKGSFALYPNHMRILKQLLELGFTALPDILWRKQTNAPNKFMGSGMLPAGAYVTLEHEYILIVRKGPKRLFKKEKDKKNRRESAIFWEERNIFYSDIWFDIKGTTQTLNKTDTRSRSAAYPFEMAYRLINMYSAKGDVVLDPFLGTGTTTYAAMASGRNSIGYEIDAAFRDTFGEIKNEIVPFSNRYIQNRLLRHIQFVIQRIREKGLLKYKNNYYGFPVIASQERELILNELMDLKDFKDDTFQVKYSEEPQKEFCKDWSKELKRKNIDRITEEIFYSSQDKNSNQLKLF